MGPDQEKSSEPFRKRKTVTNFHTKEQADLWICRVSRGGERQ